MSEKSCKKAIMERNLFIICGVFTIYVIFIILLDSFGGKAVAPETITILTYMLASYAVMRRARRYGQHIKDTRRGELFVVVVWATGIFLVIWKQFTNDPSFEISKQLAPLVKNISFIFLGGEAVKWIDINTHKNVEAK